MLNRKWFTLLSVLILNTTALVGFTQDKVNKIHWMTVEEAVAATQKEPRKIMIDVYTQWCGPCKMMAAQTFTHPDVVKYMNEKYTKKYTKCGTFAWVHKKIPAVNTLLCTMTRHYRSYIQSSLW